MPLTLVLAPLVRWAAGPVAAHLPHGGPLALRDYGALPKARHRWWVTAWSALLGAVSHLLWDLLTHPVLDGTFLVTEAAPGRPWWLVLSRISDLVGFVMAGWLAVHIGRSRLLRRWHGAPVPVRRRPARFWATVAVTAAAGTALLTPGPTVPFNSQAIRAPFVVSIAVFAGAVAVSPNSRTPLPVH